MPRRGPADDGVAPAVGVEVDGAADGEGPRHGKPTFTGRAAVLAVVVAALALALAAPARELLSQRSQISSLNSSIANQQQQVAALQKAQKQWANSTYVEQQARDRLHYVFPGQVPYVTLSPTPVASASAAAAQALASQPWYGRLWSSVQVAAHVVPTPKPTPSPTLAPALVSPPPASAPVITPAPVTAPGP
ncbi:MAG TPA: septum formation initiator family protein [Acidothermaceae bacterium]|nr:septum formation initiator family protein [Acidothermaceae bacterium]